MIFRQRCPWMIVAAVVLYLAVQVVAVAGHHHSTKTEQPATAGSPNAQPQFDCGAAASDEDEDEAACLLCSVLHQARELPTVITMTPVQVLPARVVGYVSILFAHPLESSTHSRAPPMN
jgi:hypothetical protein